MQWRDGTAITTYVLPSAAVQLTERGDVLLNGQNMKSGAWVYDQAILDALPTLVDSWKPLRLGMVANIGGDDRLLNGV